MVYNQLYLPPSKPGLNKYLGNYISYIAKKSKSKVVKNRGMEHGLFGCIESKHLPVNIQDLNKAIKYVRDKSQKDRCIMYHGFLSLSAEEITSQGYRSRTRWKDLLADKMNDVAKANNIKRENLEWIAAYHMKKDQSHCHFIFWDKNQEIKEPFMPKKLFDKKMEWIRGQFAKEIFHDVFKELYNQKDGAFKGIKSELHPFFDEFSSIITDMKDSELNEFKETLSSISSDYAYENSINPMISESNVKDLIEQIVSLKEIISRKGALKYEYMPNDIKVKIDEISLNIIEANTECKSKYHLYLDTAEEIRRIYANSPESINDAREYAKSVVVKSIGSKILKSIKKLNNIEGELGSEEWKDNHEAYEKQSAEDLILNIAYMLSRGINSNKVKANRLRKNELSKQARIELAKKLENKSIDWGQNERW